MVVAQHTSQLWPTIERALTAVGGVLAVAANVGIWVNHRTSKDIKVAINGRFTTVVDGLAEATEKLRVMTDERDRAVQSAQEAISKIPTQEHEQ